MYRTITKITKTCELCGKEFVTNKAAKHICFDDHYKTCAVCGKEFLIDWNSRNKQTCSKECMKIQMSKKLSSDEVREKTVATNLEKYGVEAPLQSDKIKEQMKEHTMEKYGVEHTSKLQSTQEQRKKTTLERYGVECVLQSEEVKDKIKETNLDRYGSENVSSNEDIKNKKSETLMKHYGVDNPMKSEEIQNRAIQTNLDKYGVKYSSQSDSVQEKIRATNQERYNCDYVFNSEEIKKKIDATNLERYGTTHPAQNPYIQQKTQNTVNKKYGVPFGYFNHPNYYTISKVNKEFAKLLYDNGFKYELELHIGRRSYDIYILDTNILIEIDPTITHNSYFNIFDEESTGKDKDYHSMKTELATLAGYRCIHVFDWDSWDSIINMLPSNNQIPITECDIKKISIEEANNFEDTYYIYGICTKQTACYGIYYQDKLVQIMTFGKPKYPTKNNYQWELYVSCTSPSVYVIEGTEHLFDYFVKNETPESIVAYCDRSKFDGTVYENMGMNLHRTINPKKIWSCKNEYITDSSLIQSLNKSGIELDITNEDTRDMFMIENGWLPVYDCGQLVFTWQNEST